MGAKITLNGNLGDDPRSGVTQDRNGEPLHWISFSMRQPHWSKNDRGEFVDSGGFWMNVSWFGKKAETAGRLLKKGAAVIVSGDLHAEIWVDKDTGEQKAGFKVNADEVAFDVRSLADVTYRQRSAERGSQPQPNLGSNHPATDGNAPADTQGASPAQAVGDDFEDMPPDMYAPPLGESTPPAPHAGKAAKSGGRKGGKAHADTDGGAPAFPTDDDRPI